MIAILDTQFWNPGLVPDLDTQILKIHPSGHPKEYCGEFLKYQFQAHD